MKPSGFEHGVPAECRRHAPPWPGVDLNDWCGEWEINNVNLLHQPLSAIGLGVRATNCLQLEGINTVGDLVVQGEGDLLSLKNFGRTTLDNVRYCLNKHGLHLNTPTQQGD